MISRELRSVSCSSIARCFILLSAAAACLPSFARDTCNLTCVDLAHKYGKCNDNSDGCKYVVGLFCINPNQGPNGLKIQSNPDAIAEINSLCKILEEETALDGARFRKRAIVLAYFTKVDASLQSWSHVFENCNSSQEKAIHCFSSIAKMKSELVEFNASLDGFSKSDDWRISKAALDLKSSISALVHAVEGQFYGKRNGN